MPTPPASPAPSPNGATEVKAPLPGVVVSVGVAEGETVERGQQLCVLEAMKMNNPIRATAPGTVREVFISPGQQVEHDAVLMRIGSPAPE
jgi:biotin carboxyl carrier protein